MSGNTSLWVGPVEVSRLPNGIGNELMAVFRDDMLRVRRIPAHQYILEYEYRDREPAESSGKEVDVIEFRAPGEAIATRLDFIGVDAASVLTRLDEQLRHPRDPGFDLDMLTALPSSRWFSPLRAFRRRRLKSVSAWEEAYRAATDRANKSRMSLDAHEWVELLASSPEYPPSPFTFGLGTGSRSWLLEELANMDERYALRAVLLAFPDAEVVLDVTGLERDDSPDESGRTSLASRAAAAIGGMAGMHAPVVVLTEGRTDAEFLTAGLAVLYPYLTDLIRFLDYERKPEGGVGALARMVRAFAAAGIVNRVVAVFDNDTAAADGLRVIDSASLPAQIRTIRYPTLDLARAYPTLGPPTAESPEGSVSLADVNGLAGSIELYLGRDVLTRPDGTLRPVQWTSFITSMARYQGEVVDKGIIHQAFRTKYAVALENSESVREQDWSGLRLILDAICAAARSAFDGPPGPRP